MVENYRRELTGFGTTKSAVHLLLDREASTELIQKLVRAGARILKKKERRSSDSERTVPDAEGRPWVSDQSGHRGPDSRSGGEVPGSRRVVCAFGFGELAERGPSRERRGPSIDAGGFTHITGGEGGCRERIGGTGGPPVTDETGGRQTSSRTDVSSMLAGRAACPKRPTKAFASTIGWRAQGGLWCCSTASERPPNSSILLVGSTDYGATLGSSRWMYEVTVKATNLTIPSRTECHCWLAT